MTPAVSSPDPGASILARGLVKVFRRGPVAKVAIDGVDLRVGCGQIFGIIGPNGAGKSTLVAMLATLTRPTRGDAWINGWHVEREARQARLALSFNASAGERGFYWRLTAYQNLEFFAALQGLAPRAAADRVRWCLGEVGLVDDPRIRFGEFSAGMKRRLNVARALLVDRPIYLFDEPTSGVDPHSGEVIRRLLRGLKQAGKTVVLVTHNMEEATQICDEVGMLFAGRMIRQESPDMLRRRVPTGEIQVELSRSEAAEEVSRRLRALPSVEAVDAHGAGRLRVRTRDPDTDVKGLLLWASTADLPIAGVSVVRPELADAFVRLVEEALGQPAEVVSMVLATSSGPAPRRRMHP